MRFIMLLGASLALGTVAAPPAHAFQIASLLVGKLKPVTAKYRKGNVIVAHAVLGRDGSSTEAYRAAMAKAAEMAEAKGYGRIGVTKVTDCGTAVMNGSRTLYHSCRVLAQMVGPDEAAKPEGKREVVYFSVAEVLGGVFRPEGASLVRIPIN